MTPQLVSYIRAIIWADSSPPRVRRGSACIRRGFLVLRWTLAESAAVPLQSAQKIHPADPPEVRRKSARIRTDPQRVCSGLESAHLIAYISIIWLQQTIPFPPQLPIFLLIYYYSPLYYKHENQKRKTPQYSFRPSRMSTLWLPRTHFPNLSTNKLP